MNTNDLTALPASAIIRMRTSRRTYRPEPLPADVMKRITELLAAADTGPMGTRLRFTLVDTGEISLRRLKLGTYGFIQGASLFIAGESEATTAGFLDYGYVLEAMIIELTRMGLGTCWLGGTFNRSSFARVVGQEEGRVIPAITPVGYASEIRRIGERIIRLGAGAKNRLPWEKIFFDRTTDAPLRVPEEHPVHLILESVRIGPSASNLQPWRIVADGNRFTFLISRKLGYRQAMGKVDIQMLDIGIAMAHFDLVARETGKSTEWQILPETTGTDNLEYVISVLLRD